VIQDTSTPQTVYKYTADFVHYSNISPLLTSVHSSCLTPGANIAGRKDTLL